MASIILSAPSSTSTSTSFLRPMILIVPALMLLSCTSPVGVLITTPERAPIKERAIGTTRFVSSELKSNTVAIPYGLERVDNTVPCSATSIAQVIPKGTFSIMATSSIIGIFLSRRLFSKTPSSACTIAPVICIFSFA